MPLSLDSAETFTPEETQALAPYFTNTDRAVFALTNLPETVKGALFARYSRSSKSLRRLFLDEFLGRVAANPGQGTGPGPAPSSPQSASGEISTALGAFPGSRSSPAPTQPSGVGIERATRLYARVLSEYGDDSVAQLGGAHVACEGVSNILTKVLERGRLMAYLEQSTRYVPYTDRPDGRWKYHVPAEIERSRYREAFVAAMDRAFETYARWIPVMEAHFRIRHPKSPADSDGVYRSAIRAKALDTLRGLLPAATQSNVGLFGTGQAYETLLLRMFAHPLEEVRAHAHAILAELREVIPAFLTRIDQPDRGGRWIDYLSDTRARFAEAARPCLDEVTREARPAGLSDSGPGTSEPEPEVVLTDFDPEGETEVVAAALYAVSDLPDERVRAIARGLTADQRESLLRAYVGSRANRRHKPGRAFECTRYRFDILADYGAFRDLQRHRLLTIDWQPLTTRHGDVEPAAIEEAGAHADWRTVMEQSADLYALLAANGLGDAASYAVAMAYRVRFCMEMNAREAMHIIELRTAPQGHPAYRRICQAMHRAIAEVAGHRAIAGAMQFANHSEIDLERLQAERATEAKCRERLQDSELRSHN